MSDLAQLLFGIAALLGTLFTGVTGLIAVFRAPKKAAKKAAEIALNRALGDDDEDDDEAQDIPAALLKLLQEKAADGGDDE